ncbi:MAG: phosphatidate cytidylyltransferase [Planctomycetota bacterium]
MTPEQRFQYLMMGIGALLGLSTVVGMVLKARVKTDAGLAVVQNLNARIRAWWVMVSIFAFTFLLGNVATLVLFGLISFLAMREYLSLTPTNPGDRAALSVAFFVLVPVQYWLVGTDWYGLFSVFLPVYAFLLLPALSALGEDTDEFLERNARLQWGVMVTVFCLSHVPALLLLDIEGYEGNATLIFFLLLVVQLSDVFQYICGKLFGRTKVAPVVSPSKTLEGLLGGGLIATAIGAAMWWITPFTFLQAAGMSLVIVLMGFLGGLVLSAVKRSLGAKDWGTMIQGHGGMLDRMDSVCFAAPVFFHLTRYWFHG